MILVGWVFFRCETLGQAVGYLAAMAGVQHGRLATPGSYLAPDVQLAFVAGLIACTPWPTKFLRWIHERADGALLETAALAGLAALFLLSVMQLASGTYNPFIYFRF